MKTIVHKLFKPAAVVTAAATLFASCNKDLPEATPIVTPAPTGASINGVVKANLANFSILDSAILRAGTNTVGFPPMSVSAMLSDSTGNYTVFAPTNAAFQASGIPFGLALFSGAFPAPTVASILSYHIVPGVRLRLDSVPQTFPNIQLPTALVLAQPSATLPPGLRASVFVSRRGNTVWVNNIPVLAGNVQASNGIIHNPAGLLLPPSRMIWDTINNGANFTYLKAAIQRADSGQAAASTLVAALSNPAANFTLFAPTNAAFQQTLTAVIYQKLRQQGIDSTTSINTATALASTPGVFTNPALATVLTPTLVRGLLAYHTLLGPRVFSVNIPTAATNVNTLLNGSVPTAPPIVVQAIFNANGLTVQSATVKGFINTAPANTVSRDLHFINGVVHTIDQVLIPFPL
jgi:uncharacterized surface protein with fasciclin (FAS1) repeats